MKTVRFSVLLVAALALAEVMAAAEGPSGQPPLPPPLRTAPSSGIRVPARPADSVTNPPAAALPNSAQPGKPGALVFDSTSRRVDLAEGETTAAFVFAVTNTARGPVTVSYINTSCGCTAGKLPAYPWVLKPGEGGLVDVSMNLAGKFGLVTKTATVVSSAGSYVLTVAANVPVAKGGMQNRSRNLQVAAADRQAVFRNDCANCHVQPTIGKMGRDLYDTACGICHEAEHRAQMVPDLRTRLKNTDRNYWTKWITDGRQGSLMPAFLAKNGGILNEDQVNSLVEYLETEYKKNPPPSKTVPVQAALAPAPTAVKPAPAAQ